MTWHGKDVEVIGRLQQFVTVRCEGRILQIPESQLIPDKGHRTPKPVTVSGCAICKHNAPMFRDLISTKSRRREWADVCDCCSRIFCMGFREPLDFTSEREKLWKEQSCNS